MCSQLHNSLAPSGAFDTSYIFSIAGHEVKRIVPILFSLPRWAFQNGMLSIPAHFYYDNMCSTVFQCSNVCRYEVGVNVFVYYTSF